MERCLKWKDSSGINLNAWPINVAIAFFVLFDEVTPDDILKFVEKATKNPDLKKRIIENIKED